MLESITSEQTVNLRPMHQRDEHVSVGVYVGRSLRRRRMPVISLLLFSSHLQLTT